jgi:hypothetical protein
MPASTGDTCADVTEIAKVLLLGSLWFALIGAPMSPQEIEELLCQMNVPKVAHVLQEQSDRGDPPAP